jgi:diacylglycerol kinase (ATP)
MPHYTDIAIIYNPNSTGNAEKNAKQLRDRLKKSLSNVPLTMLPTKRAGHAEELAYDFAKNKKSPLIISASGDGGYNEVVNGALKAQDEGASPICAVLPSGNANDHARTMQDNPLADLIQKGQIVKLEVLKLEADGHDGKKTVRYAHSYLGIGLTPTVAVELNKHTLNSLKEAWIVTKTFWNYRPVVIRRNGKTIKLDSLICSIIPEMAKVLTISKNTSPHDGLFEITTFRHHRRISLLFRLIKGVFSHLGAEERADRMEFELLMPAPMQIDGEVVELDENTHISVKICPGLLRTLADV